MSQLFLHAKEVQHLMAKSRSYAYKIIKSIKHSRPKPSTAPVTVKEFAFYFGLEVEEVYNALLKKY